MNCTPVEPRAPQDHLAIPRAARGGGKRKWRNTDLSSLTLLSLFFHLGCKDPEEISEDDNCIQLFQELLE
ncbi:hypothetical protein Y1Q_0018858 [Alligator mississippiensis]|uniref:Uncharacterized protein n=1 Tax=Alligator mississippiensis TaxID=8496 RepID=A0A151M2Y9_ALLMI|nr:hypothetical protein Y1Q_0018858 [Alligator mississippiensis]